MGDFEVKNAIIARSGMYQYAKAELSALGLGAPPAWVGDKGTYNVLRPAPVIAVAVKMGKFSHLPLTNDHPPEWVTPDTFRDYTVGWTGDTARMDYLSDIDEAVVRSTVIIGDAEAADAYAHGVRELSHGYRASFRWRGEHEKGAWDAVMVSIDNGNHVALVPRGRAGSAAAILDSRGRHEVSKFKSGLLRLARMRLARGAVQDAAVRDNHSFEAGFEDGLAALIQQRATLKDDDVSARVDELKKLVEDVPEGDERSLLMRYLDDLRLMKDETDEVLYEVKSIVCALVRKLDEDLDEEKEDAEGGEEPESQDGVAEVSMDKKVKDKGVIRQVIDLLRGVTDEPGSVPETPADPKPAAAPAAAPAPAAPASAGQFGPPAGQKWNAQQWADGLFAFMDAMKADLQTQGSAAPVQPGAAPAPAAALAQKPAAAPPAPPAAEAPKAEDAVSDPPNVPVQKPDGSDKPGKPEGDETEHPKMAVDAEMPTITAGVRDTKEEARGGGIEETYKTLKGG